MKRHRHIMAGIAGALLVGTCLTPAFAAGVSVGGVSVSIGGNSGGGTTAAASVGGVSGSMSIGGGGDTVATANVTTADPATDTTATIGNTDGPLATLDTDGQTTDAAVNLGGLLSSLGEIADPAMPTNPVTDAGVIIGGGNGNVATGTVGTTDPTTDTTVSIGFTDGPLAALDTDGQTTDAAVNLGGLLSGLEGIDVPTIPTIPTIPGDGNAPGNDDGDNGNGDNGAGNGGALASAYGSLGAGEQQALKIKCRNVLAQPGSFAANVVTLCRMIASL
jgi:hypothetical protein